MLSLIAAACSWLRAVEGGWLSRRDAEEQQRGEKNRQKNAGQENGISPCSPVPPSSYLKVFRPVSSPAVTEFREGDEPRNTRNTRKAKREDSCDRVVAAGSVEPGRRQNAE